MENKKQEERYNNEFYNEFESVNEGTKLNGKSVNVVMPKEEMAKKNFKLTKDRKARVVVGTLALIIVAGIVVFCVKSCGKSKNAGNVNTDNTISYSDDELKTIYIDKETYLQNVQSLAQYLNNYGNKNVKPVDLNSFYYLANMDNIKTSTFKELVEEGYLPESETDIIIQALGIMDDLRDTVALEGIAGKEASVDYSKIFVNSRTAKVFSSAQDVYNGAVKTVKGHDRDSILEGKEPEVTNQLVSIGEKEDNYELGENTLNVDIPEFGTLSAAEQVIYYNLQAKTFDILLANYGVSVGGEARDYRIDDIANLVVSLRGEFACLQDEQGKAYQK